MFEEKGLEGWVAAKTQSIRLLESYSLHGIRNDGRNKRSSKNQWLVIVIKTVLVVATVIPNCNCHPGCGTPNKEDYKQTLQNRLSEQLKKD